MEFKSKKEKLAQWVWVVTLTFLLLFNAYFLIFHVTWMNKYGEYVDVDWEWNDDTDRYEIAIWDEGEFNFYTIPTNKAQIVYIEEEFMTYCVIRTQKTILNKGTKSEVKKFYILPLIALCVERLR